LEPIPINIFFLYLILIHTLVGGNSVSFSLNDTDTVFMYSKFISSKQLFALDINLLCRTCVDLKFFSVFTMKL
jgi:hypothetical protein